MEPKIQYLSYVAVLQSQDAEWTRLTKTGPGYSEEEQVLCKVFDETNKNLQRYKEGLKNNLDNFLKTPGQSKKAKNEYKSYLFTPSFYLPFGHADALSIYLVDDFDPIHSVTAESSYLTEEISIAFCPSKNSLGLGKCFVELAAIFEEKEVSGSSCSPTKFQREFPLFAFTKLKMDGLAVLGQGLLVQEAAFKAIGLSIESTLKSTELLPEYEGLVSRDDVEKTRFSMLDLQGQEEIGLIFFGTNFSVMTTVVNRLQQLSLGDMLAAHEDLYQENSVLRNLLLENSKSLHHIIASLASDSNSASIEKLIDQNPLFKWVNTTAAQAFKVNLEAGLINGSIAMELDLQIAPGCQQAADEIISENKSFQSDTPNNIDQQISMHTLGTTDKIVGFRKGNPTKNLPDNLGDTYEVVAALRNTKSDIACFNDENKYRPLVGLTPRLSIPAIRQSIQSQKPLISLIELVLPRIKNEIFNHGKKMDLRPLRDAPKHAGIPMALRRSIIYLFQNYTNLLTNPLLFDMVIDLYDSFSALYSAITSDALLDKCNRVTSNHEGSRTRYILRTRYVDDLSDKVEALHNAFNHRVGKAFPEEPVRDLSVLFQGQLSQILFAADAPLKCGVGVLRRSNFGTQNDHATAQYSPPSYNSVGVSVTLGFRPGMSVNTLDLFEGKHPTLAFFAIDVPHLLHVTTYCDYLHESFHLVFERVLSEGGNSHPFHRIGLSQEIDSKKLYHDRYNELFVHLLTHLFLCKNDIETYAMHNLAQYTLSSASKGNDMMETVLTWVETSLRYYTVSYVIRKGWNNNAPSDSIEELGTIEDRIEFDKGFQEFFQRYGYLHSEYESLKNDNDNWKNLMEFASASGRKYYGIVNAWLPDLWKQCVDIYSGYITREIGNETPHDKIDLIQNTASDVLSKGKPLICSLINSEFVSVNDSVAPDVGANPMVSLCSLLYHYIKRVKETENKSVHVRRHTSDPLNRKSADILFHQQKPSSDFLIDQCSATMFCCQPDKREERLLQQISIIKSMWGISSAIRARRFGSLLNSLN